MNYIGSKLKLSTWIKEVIKQEVGSDLSQKTFCDLFAGTGIVGRTFKNEVKHVISNDLEYYSYVLNKNYIENVKEIENAKELIDELNNLPLIENGFIYLNYCIGSGSGRQYFSDFNGKKIDTIRTTIEKWRERRRINKSKYYYLLASLLESADKVANTASVYGAFLKHLKKTAQQKLVLESADFSLSDNQHAVFNKDANNLIKQIKGDILYLDPPYNQRQYGAYYHMPNTIAEYKPFIPKGKTGQRDYNRSNYCKKSNVKVEFESLIYLFINHFMPIFSNYN